ncbi:translation initiation factor IF-2-like [Aquila chrysaetos chrysaetos]|uniref:translation initiation factor IF-2-like n=1 Tax=Aquila chrysaetos chrysaetos TaxID=223781 RepID=UPI001B7D405E|nr:translation initiation factor IF-2-like [Aquila chrysaetos chrysaetos]
MLPPPASAGRAGRGRRRAARPGARSPGGRRRPGPGPPLLSPRRYRGRPRCLRRGRSGGAPGGRAQALPGTPPAPSRRLASPPPRSPGGPRGPAGACRRLSRGAGARTRVAEPALPAAPRRPFPAAAAPEPVPGRGTEARPNAGRAVMQWRPRSTALPGGAATPETPPLREPGGGGAGRDRAGRRGRPAGSPALRGAPVPAGSPGLRGAGG